MHQNGAYIYSSKNQKIILLIFFYMRDFRGICSSFDIRKGYLDRESWKPLV